ncbi:MAG: hypothetical protein IJX99_10755 [Clostridia bacterium]|nr:hypothetical protein [Clostridia bacterium]
MNGSKKAEDIRLSLTLVFQKNTSEPNTWGSNAIVYKINYYYDKGIMEVWSQGAFGDWTLENRFRDRRNRGITEDEMLENIKEMSKMTYKEFKEKLLKR